MIRAGTSGYNYDAWRGSFYPDDLSQAKMLGFYGSQLSTVEINYTFRRMPTEKALTNWAAQVPKQFCFALKAPFWIVNQKKVAESVKALQPFLDVTSILGPRRGPILFQFPPTLKQDLPRLQAFLEALPKGVRAAFEFREPSWHHDEVQRPLIKAGATMCITDDEELQTPLGKTARWGYLRLRREDYDKKAIARWRKKIAELELSEVFVYFKHEDSGSGPRLAKLLQSG